MSPSCCINEVLDHVFIGGWLLCLAMSMGYCDSLVSGMMILCMLVEATVSSQYASVFVWTFMRFVLYFVFKKYLLSPQIFIHVQ
jgi:hypothetical protein